MDGGFRGPGLWSLRSAGVHGQPKNYNLFCTGFPSNRGY